MSGEIQVTRIEHRGLTDEPLQYRRLQIIDHDFRRHAMKRFEGMLMAGEEVLQALREGEFQVHEPAMTEHHHEKAEAPSSRADRDRAVLAPVHLGGFAFRKGEREEGGRSLGTYLADVLFDNRIAAFETDLPQPL